jgi:hypothetical protein
LAVEALFDGEAGAITRKVIEMAKAGDSAALRLRLDRIHPARKDRPVPFALPPIKKAADTVQAAASIIEAVAAGDLTPSEAAELSKVIDGFTRSIESARFEARLEHIEAALAKEAKT